MVRILPSAKIPSHLRGKITVVPELLEIASVTLQAVGRLQTPHLVLLQKGYCYYCCHRQ